MPWLASVDHTGNFHQRTLTVRDAFGIEVLCALPLPHSSIRCQVVTAKSFRATCAYERTDEIGLCFLRAVATIESSLADLSSDPRVARLLDEFTDIFESPTDVVSDRPISHEIILEAGVVPPKGCIYRMSEEELEVLRAQLDDLLDKGWIRRSSSPYGAPVLFVRKKNKDLRLCIDYRKLNSQTVKNAGPLPRIDDLLERLGGTKFFSKLDLKSGYHQISIHPQDCYKSAFKTWYGHFEWIVMPFGLTNAPTTFQVAMTNEFRAMLDRFVYDILVYSRTLEDYLEHLRRVLETLRRAKYKANRDKCEFVWQELEYLGHFVTPEGISPLSDKIQAIQEWPEPKTVTNVHSFLGLVGYYQRFIKGYSKIAAPSSKLQCEDRPFDFDDHARTSFLALKATSAEVLHIYDPLLPTRVTTDASGYGIGAVLEQHDGVDWHPIEYFSKKVPAIHSINDARKKELLAFVHALKRWQHFLLGRRQFRLVTDNNPLIFYKTQDTVNSTIACWMTFIDQFDFFPDHIPGKSNRFADILSRRPDHCTVVYSTFEINDDLRDSFIRGYQVDPEFCDKYANCSSPNPAPSYYRIQEWHLLVHMRGKDLLCVPIDPHLRTRLLGEFHDAPATRHFGVNDTIGRLRERLWWPDLLGDVTRYCKSCEVCRRCKSPYHRPYELRPLPVPLRRREAIAMDITGPLPKHKTSVDGILMVVDRLTKFAMFLPCRYHAKPELVEVLLTDYLRCLPAEVRTKLVDESYVEQHTFASFSKKALGIEAKLGSAHQVSHDGRKRLPQDWKKKGQLMFIDHDGQTTEIDDFVDLGEVTEQDGASETSDGGVVAPIQEKARGTGKKKVVRARALASSREAANVAAREQAAVVARATTMSSAAASSTASSVVSSSGPQLGMPIGSTGTSSAVGSRQSTSQMAGSQFSPLTPRERELRELQQVERIRERLERELKQATDREREIKNRTARLDTLEADKAELEGLDDSGMNEPMKVLRNNMLSLHAHVDSMLDFMQNTLDQILEVLTMPGFRPPGQSPLPLSAMSDPFPVQAGTQPSGTSAAVAHIASSSSGPAVGATPPQQLVQQSGQPQGQWYPKTPMKPPLAFSGERKDEELNTWLRTVPVWVKAKRTLLEDEVVTAASYLEGKATKWLDGVVVKAGYGRRMADWAKSLTLDQFMEMVEARWHNPQEAQRVTDAINKLDQRKFKSVRELTNTVESPILVPGINYSDQFLLTTFVRCLPESIRNLVASEARVEYHSFETLSRKALDLEATLGNAQPSHNDTKKKKSPQEWKKKGAKLMMVESDGTQMEIDELTDLMDYSEADYLGTLVSDFGVSEEVTQSLVGAYQEDPVTMDIMRKLQAKDKATERQSVSMDFMDTLVTSKSGKRHIFVIIDRFTKYARLVAMPETARTDYVIKLFKDNWVAHPKVDGFVGALLGETILWHWFTRAGGNNAVAAHGLSGLEMMIHLRSQSSCLTGAGYGDHVCWGCASPVEGRSSPMGEPADKWSMSGEDCKGQGDSVQVEEGPTVVVEEEVGVEGSGPAERGACRVKRLAAGAGGSGRGLVMGVEESIMVKHAREEVSKGHVGFVGEGVCKIFMAYSLDAGDERKVGNDGGGEVMAEGADVLDEAVLGTGLAEVTELFEVVIDGFLGAEGDSEKVGPLEEGVARSFGGAADADFGHPPFGDIVEKAGGGNGKSVDKGHVVELERVLELGKEEENVLVGKAGEGHDVSGSEGTGDFPFPGNDPGEGVEVEVIGGSVIAGVIEMVVVVKEVVGGKLWHCGLNPEGDLGIGGTGGGDGGGHHDVFSRALLLTESKQRSDMLMEDWAMVGEEGMDDVTGVEVEAVAANVIAVAAAARRRRRRRVGRSWFGVVACGDGGDNSYLQE
ncbi:hypothetical protein CBR_g25721 [Chara braunii]|uniref:Reverse transcriptase domain-containing protein n=1 Tax=Chara braunii TaxID=69332 RepID=A0A388L657_CHABU|nr:hypothetical protein CBR_g25721 [Chara braunii]|eukprot:GBG77790.1 hypothetical protein CBR_g25721 [Chara braunii]